VVLALTMLGTMRLAVDASGEDEPATSTWLAATGSTPLGAALLEFAALVSGFTVVALARIRRRD